MQLYAQHRLWTVAIITVVAVVVFILVEILYIKFNGKPVPVPTIPRQPVSIGSGTPLTYVIMGDSTSISQGGDYNEGIAIKTAEFLARNHAVTYYNFGESGARTTDVALYQLDKAVAVNPDVVLLAAGANDVTHFTRLADTDAALSKIISRLQKANPKVKIVLTGSPQMGSVPRFPWPIRTIAEYRTQEVNTVVKELTSSAVLLAPIAKETGPLFKSNPSLFSQDNFHPNTEGYQTWTPVITKALNAVMNR